MDLFKTWLVETPVAHRGFHDKKSPENSLSAFKNAIDKGYNIELDVQMLSDGTVAVFHDESLSRMTGNDGYLKFLTKEDLKMLTLKDSKETIPTLEEVLDFVNGKAPIIIEIKNKSKVGKLEQKVIDLLKNYKGEYAICSFNPLVLSYFKENAPKILRGQLAGSLKGEKLSLIKKWALRGMWLTKKLNLADFIMYEAKALPTHRLGKLKKLPLLAWTVKTQQEYLRVVKYSDNVIFENFEPRIWFSRQIKRNRLTKKPYHRIIRFF